MNGCFVASASVRTGQADTAPEVSVSRNVKTFDGTVDAFHIGPVNEPQASPEALVECASGISGKPGRSRSFRAAELPGLEVALVETVAVEHQPAKQIVGPRSYRHPLGQASDCPSHAYMHHVAMLP